MNVSDLIKKLKNLPKDLEVYCIIHDQRPYHTNDIKIWVNDGSDGYPYNGAELNEDEEKIVVIDAT